MAVLSKTEDKPEREAELVFCSNGIFRWMRKLIGEFGKVTGRSDAWSLSRGAAPFVGQYLKP